jgi:hypothetical protein
MLFRSGELHSHVQPCPKGTKGTSNFRFRLTTYDYHYSTDSMCREIPVYIFKYISTHNTVSTLWPLIILSPRFLI